MLTNEAPMAGSPVRKPWGLSAAPRPARACPGLPDDPVTKCMGWRDAGEWPNGLDAMRLKCRRSQFAMWGINPSLCGHSDAQYSGVGAVGPGAFWTSPPVSLASTTADVPQRLRASTPRAVTRRPHARFPGKSRPPRLAYGVHLVAWCRERTMTFEELCALSQKHGPPRNCL